MLQDLRYAVRMLLRNKGWTIVVVISLALGIGANAALFSVINGLLLRRLDVDRPETLVRLRFSGENEMATNSSDYGYSEKVGGMDVRATFSYPMYQQLLADNRTMTDLLACAPMGRVNVVVNGQAEIASSFIVSGNYHRLLGAAARPGRTIAPEDDRPSATPVAVISPGYWGRRFGNDPSVVGKTVQVNNTPVIIIGVTVPGFTGIQQAVGDPPDITVPLALDSRINNQERLSRPTYWWLQIMGRLKAGVTAAQVQGNLEGVFRQTASAGWDSYFASLSAKEQSTSGNQNRTEIPRLRVDSGSRGIYDVNAAEIRSVTILSVVVALVLLIVCANVANLLLSRAATRQKEISVRISIGASRARLIRQLLTESLLLAVMGGSLGILVGYWGKQLLPARSAQVPPDWRFVLFVSGLTVFSGIVFGIAPALRATGINVSATLKENSRTASGSRNVLSKSLLVAQVAIALVLLIGAGLFLRTLQNLRQVNVGFNPQNLILFRVNPQLNRYDEIRIANLYAQMMGQLREVPGVRAVSLSQPALLSGSVSSTGLIAQGKPYFRGPQNDINRVTVAPSFFETMEIPLLAGRGFTERDNQAGPKVAVINEAAARKFFANENPIGRRFGSSPETSDQIEIVGVVRDAKYNDVREPAPATEYIPYLQARLAGVVFEVRTVNAPTSVMGAVREMVRQIDPNLPLTDMSTQMEQLERRFLQEKVFAQAYALFGGLALLLASIGLFGLMSYSVSRRTNEIGIRMALGAQRGDVLGLVMRESMILVFIGIGIGLAAALGAARLIATLLFGLAATDARTMLVAIAVMICVSALAGYLPARRASRVDPMVALHYE